MADLANAQGPAPRLAVPALRHPGHNKDRRADRRTTPQNLVLWFPIRPSLARIRRLLITGQPTAGELRQQLRDHGLDPATIGAVFLPLRFRHALVMLKQPTRDLD